MDSRSGGVGRAFPDGMKRLAAYWCGKSVRNGTPRSSPSFFPKRMEG